MACLLNIGRKVPCKSAVGGIKTVYFTDYGTMGNPTFDADDIITGLDGTPVYYQYDVKGTSSLETTVNSSRDNGTTFYTQTLNLTLTFLDAATRNELKVLAHGRPQVVIEDYNGNFFVVGLENGAEVTGGSIATGAAMGDLSGFTLTFEAMEKTPPYFIEPTVIEAYTSASQIDPTA
tara:strand:- start:661 stop:1191 length:531 start_codon:yes stop_codon:yes gene_type:complete